jgi:L-lactate dehydrogenase complex protein LldE
MSVLTQARNASNTPERQAAPRVGLFVTCIVDAMRPRIGFAAISLLEDAGCRVEVPRAQTCCGQPALNSGDREAAAAVARGVIATFEGYDYVVAPSGSCAGTIRTFYEELLAGKDEWAARARALSAKTYEIMSFLVDVCRYRPNGRAFRASATYHDSCHGLRELGVFAQPRELLGAVAGLELHELAGSEICCGFGGTFCIKYPDISNAIVEEKVTLIEQTQAELLLAGDLSCLLNMAGKLHRRGSPVRAFHAVEVLAGIADGPAIGEED